MEKKLYWLVESNGDLSNTVTDLQEAISLISGEFEVMSIDEQKETYYTITPKWYTDRQYSKLPEG